MADLPSVLVVDDQPGNRETLRALLAPDGIAVTLCASGAEALASASAAPPDLVLLDVMMPGADGFEICRRLRADATLGEVPIILVTALDDRQSRLTGFEAGADDFVTKPYDRAELRTRVRGLLRLNRFRRLLEQRAEVEKQRASLAQTEKLAAMGSLLAGVAHELNNPLAVITGSAELLLRHPLPETDRRSAERILGAGERCARIVRNFLALARQRPPQRFEVQLGAVVQDALELLAHELRANGIAVELRLDPSAPSLWADGHRLHQVVVNLVTNAAQALRARKQGRALVLTTTSAADQVTIEVADNGPGIPLDLQEKVFEPFFTTKPAGEGTGLGLSLCRSVALDHGGTLDVRSAPGEGATFRLTLPVRHGKAPAPAAEPVIPKRSCRVLVVDDDESFADVLAEILRDAGHTVELALDGERALAALEGARPDLIVCDMIMAGLDGPALHAQVASRWPGLERHFVFMTGDTLRAETRTFLERAGRPILEKPFTAEEARNVVARAAADLSPRGSRA